MHRMFPWPVLLLYKGTNSQTATAIAIIALVQRVAGEIHGAEVGAGKGHVFIGQLTHLRH